MSPELLEFARRELAAAAPARVGPLARDLAQASGARAALFYGSILRSGDLGGVLDFYLLTPAPHRQGLRGLLERWLWPEVGFHQGQVGDQTLRAKTAVMPLATFRRASEGRTLDTTVWARFAQPAALVWAADDAAAEQVAACVAAACETAARFAAALGPPAGAAADYWTELFRRTYAAELRMERPGRERQILGFHPGRYEQLLPLAWRSAGISFHEEDGRLRPELSGRERRRLRAAWRLRGVLGKSLNAARLAKAAFTFEGAARYAAWKIERHTGLSVAVTPFRERHPILAAPTVFWRLWRARARQPEAR